MDREVLYRKLDEQAELYAKLKKSLKVQDVWPEAFNLGQCTLKCSSVGSDITACYLEREGDGTRKYIDTATFQELGGSLPPKGFPYSPHRMNLKPANNKAMEMSNVIKTNDFIH